MLEPDDNPNPRAMVDPPGWMRRLQRLRMASLVSERAIARRRRRAETRRRRDGRPHLVEYFHQLDDPYSHLTAQVVAELTSRYDISLRPHLIRATGGLNQPEPASLAALARRDAELIAPHLGLDFPTSAPLAPSREKLHEAVRLLAAMSSESFIAAIGAVSKSLWDDSREPSEPSTRDFPDDRDLEAILEQGSQRLQRLGHYSGATFYYEGEWYWGVDRLYHLELRLRQLGAGRRPDLPPIAPRPQDNVTGIDARRLELEFYPSLNSPYTAVIYDRTIALKNACGIKFRLRPVLPMIMRGVPATPEKARYIMFDAKREAEALGVPFGRILTPIGEPTRRAYSLLPWAAAQGRDEDLMSALLHHAFALGVGLDTTHGLRRAVRAAGLDWRGARAHLGDPDWQSQIKANQLSLRRLGLWGVPSYRLRGPRGEPDLVVWGQDRLWLVAAEIRRRSGLPTDNRTPLGDAKGSAQGGPET